MNAATLATAPDDASLLSPEMIARLGHLALVARRHTSVRRAGRRRTRRVGTGIETIDLRAYAAGDDPRRIAWHAYARLEKLLTRLVADEAPMRLTLVVDESASMAYRDLDGSSVHPTKIRQAARVAAGLAAVALGGDDRVALAAGSSQGIRALRPVSGRGGLPRLLAALEQLRPGATTDLPKAVRVALDAGGGRGGVCVLVSDLFEPQGALAGAREARRRGQEVALVEVLAPFEYEPPDLSGWDLEDEETGEVIEVPEREAAVRFGAALAAHRARIDEAARELGAIVVRTTTAEPFEAIVTRALRAGLVGGSR